MTILIIFLFCDQIEFSTFWHQKVEQKVPPASSVTHILGLR